MQGIDESLSKEARAVLGAWFGMGGDTTLTLRLQQSRPTEKAQAALDELVAAGILAHEPFNQFGGIVYRPTRETRPYLKWLHEHVDDPACQFRLMEPIKASADVS